ncbi:MAG: transcriptional repressor [Alphaproteobacteria bacterium]|nr:transcriptional repressor [Alphaproteobacteria bacterium]
MAKRSSLFPTPRHDHGACVAAGLARAEEVCRGRRERLTENRRQVLELLLAEHRLAGAYDILERFDWKGRKPAPAQIYRALSFLETMGLVHRVASRDAYVACSSQDEGHGTVLLVCEQCGVVAEPSAAELRRIVQQLAGKSGFQLHAHTLEVIGRCPDCAVAADA